MDTTASLLDSSKWVVSAAVATNVLFNMETFPLCLEPGLGSK